MTPVEALRAGIIVRPCYCRVEFAAVECDGIGIAPPENVVDRAETLPAGTRGVLVLTSGAATRAAFPLSDALINWMRNELALFASPVDG